MKKEPSDIGKTYTARSDSPFGHGSDEIKHNETIQDQRALNDSSHGLQVSQPSFGVKPTKSQKVRGNNHEKQVLEESPTLKNKQLHDASEYNSNGSFSKSDSRGSVIQSGIGSFTVE